MFYPQVCTFKCYLIVLLVEHLAYNVTDHNFEPCSELVLFIFCFKSYFSSEQR